MFRLVIIALAALLAASVTTVPVRAEAEGVTPISAYGALPAVEKVSISPDGASVALVRNSGEQSQVVAMTLDGTPLVAINTTDRRVRSLSWASPNHLVVASASTEHVPFFRGRSEVNVLDVINVRTQRAERVMKQSDRRSYNAVFDWIVGSYDGEPVLYVEAITETAGRYSLDVYRVNLDTGRGRIHAEGASDTQGYIVRRDGSVAARVAYNPENGRWRLSAKAGGGWRDIHQVKALLDRPAVFGLGRTADTVAIADEVDGEWRLMEVSLGDGSERTRLDIEGWPNRIVRGPDGLLIGVGFLGTRQEYEFLSTELTEAWNMLKQTLPSVQLTLAGYSDDLKRLIVYVEGANDPGSYLIYDSAAQQISQVGRAYPGLANVPLGPVEVTQYKAADGLELFGYLTMPPGRARSNLPLVVMPHGGPASRDLPGFDWWAQALASRGYVVFQPQFRGSSGFGEELLEAGYGEWGRKMQTDLSDGVNHLRALGLIDEERVCIVGASYGGYAALAGATMQPDIYRCAVAVAGVSDLREMLQEEERRGARGDANPAVRYWRRFMGAESVMDRSIDAYSPSKLVGENTSPILLIHGRDDTVVPFAQSQIMSNALKGSGRLVSLNGEDHYLSKPATRQQMLVETLSFLEQHNPATP